MSAETTYRRQNPASARLHERSRQALAGGTTRPTTYFQPFPLYLSRGEGPRIWDADGNERLDFILNYTALILGHAHPKIVEAVREQVARGTAFAAANELEVELAELLCERVPSLELVRFCNSGTEATMFALRVARAFTGRERIARVQGGYHGTHDVVSERPDAPSWAVEATVFIPFNDADGAERVIREKAGELAAVIVEPVIGSGGVIVAGQAYLERLRAVTRELGIVLVFDEVISLRLAPGGYQEVSGVTPDLTTMGKIIGGGLPVAAFGGRREVMEILDPRSGAGLRQGGTYNGNPLGMAAGLAALRELTPDIYVELNRRGERVAEQAREIFATHGLRVQVNSAGSIFAFHFSDQPVEAPPAAAAADKRRAHELFLALLNEGVMMAPRLMGGLATVHEEPELDRFAEALDTASRTL